MKQLLSATACWTPFLGCACAVVQEVLLAKLRNIGIFRGNACKQIVAVVHFCPMCCNEYKPMPYLFVLWPAFPCYSLFLSAQGLNRGSNNKKHDKGLCSFSNFLGSFIAWKIFIRASVI